MKGTLEKTVFDCPDPRALAAFYAQIWPDPGHPQQLHLDIRVDDVDTAEREVMRLGARRMQSEHENGFRVFLDPAGHPFCLVGG
jgi:hypothetical protein